MKVALYLDISNRDIEYNKDCLEGNNNFSFHATTIPYCNNEDESMDRIKITIDLPNRYFDYAHDFEAVVESAAKLSNTLKEDAH